VPTSRCLCSASHVRSQPAARLQIQMCDVRWLAQTILLPATDGQGPRLSPRADVGDACQAADGLPDAGLPDNGRRSVYNLVDLATNYNFLYAGKTAPNTADSTDAMKEWIEAVPPYPHTPYHDQMNLSLAPVCRGDSTRSLTPIPPYPHTPIPLVTATWNILCDNRVRMWVDPMCARVCYEPSWSWKSTAVDAMHMQHTHQISFVFPTRLRAHSSSFFWHSVSRKYCQQLEHTTSAPESFSRVCESALFITYTSSGGCLPAHLQ
jgi:hypothetical protein